MMQTDNFKPFKGVEMTKSVERRGPSSRLSVVRLHQLRWREAAEVPPS